jgi:nitrogen regulatory protein PII
MAMGGLRTAASDLVELLGLEPHKAVIRSVVREDKIDEIMNSLEGRFATSRNGKGSAFAVPLSSVIGVNMYRFLSDRREL